MVDRKRYVDGVVMMVKGLLGAYGMTLVALLLLALALYRFQLGEEVVAVSIIGIYIGITFVCGFLIGKKSKKRKFLWGMISGGLYFLVLVMISLLVNHTLDTATNHMITTCVLCIGSGTLGGMLA